MRQKRRGDKARRKHGAIFQKSGLLGVVLVQDVLLGKVLVKDVLLGVVGVQELLLDRFYSTFYTPLAMQSSILLALGSFSRTLF